MAKIRGVKPDLWTDENFVELSPFARLLWVGMWNYACDNGHVQDKTKQIKMRVLPTDDVNCAELLREIESQGLIERAGGWITIPNLSHHQKPHKRWYVVCDKPDCEFPEGASYGFDRSAQPKKASSQPESTVEQPLVNDETASNNGGTTADGDGELMVKVKGVEGGRPKGSRKTQLPKDFSANDTNRRIAAERGVDLNDLEPKFKDWAVANGATYIDWHSALNTWIRRERPGTQPAPVRDLTEARDIELPPDGLTDEEWVAWDNARRERRKRA